MLSVIDFALAAPVGVQEHEVRVSVGGAAKDRIAISPLRRDPSDKWLANAADWTNAAAALPIPRSSNSDSDPTLPIAKPPLDLNADPIPSPPLQVGPGHTSPSLTSRSLTDEPDPLNLPSPHGNTYLNPSPYQSE
jgi:hypothetical protein